jgi:predicted transcriptional regulator
MSEDPNSTTRAELTADIVVAYVSNNRVTPAELAPLIQQINSVLGEIQGGAAAPPAEKQAPAVPIRKSITSEYIISLEDGQKYKSLKRHLMRKYGMTPADYRTKWNLPKDYPMVAPSYSAARSAMAKAAGLGVARKETAAQAPPKTAPAKSPANPRGRKPKAAPAITG